VAGEDWRIRIAFPQGEREGLLHRLGFGVGKEAEELAEELREQRLAVSADEDDNEVFVYAPTRADAERARQLVLAELADEGLEADVGPVEGWIDEEDRWDHEAPGPTVEEELVAAGHAPWEVRVNAKSHNEARELADRLEARGLPVVRRWKYVLVGASTREEAEELARELHGRAEPGSELIYEVLPQNPFAIFGGLGGSGTPL
jgi:hypothetical protein